MSDDLDFLEGAVGEAEKPVFLQAGKRYLGVVTAWSGGKIKNENATPYLNLHIRATEPVDEDETFARASKELDAKYWVTAKSEYYVDRDFEQVFGIPQGTNRKDALEAIVGQDVLFTVKHEQREGSNIEYNTEVSHSNTATLADAA